MKYDIEYKWLWSTYFNGYFCKAFSWLHGKCVGTGYSAQNVYSVLSKRITTIAES